MQTIVPTQAAPQPAQPQQKAQPGSAKQDKQDSFGAQLDQAQTASSSFKDDQAVASPIEEPLQEEIDAATAETLVAVMIPAAVFLTQPQEAEATADTEESSPILPLVVPDEGVAPQAHVPQAQAAIGQDPQAPSLEQGIDILKRPAQEAETSPSPAAQAEERPVMDDAPFSAKEPKAEDLSARMPAEIPIESWELERQTGEKPAWDSSSLENVDAEEATSYAPPSRVEITQVVGKGQRDAQADMGEDKAPAAKEAPMAKESPLPPVAQAPFAVDMGQADSPVEKTPGVQIVEEAQIQQAMGRTQFTMRLNPENLGEVTVRLTMIGEQLTARIITRTESARTAIATELNTLGDAMRDKGVDVRSVQVIDSSMSQASLLHDGGKGGGQWQEGRRQRHVQAQGVAPIEEAQGMELPGLGALEGDRVGVEIQA